MKRLLFALVLLAQPVLASPLAQPTIPVEIWFSGDDGLTQRLVDSLRQAVASESDFRLAPAYTNGAFKIFIPTHVGWKPGAQGLLITATAEFSMNGKPLGKASVTCTDNSLNVCANGIVAAAKSTLASARPAASM